MTILMPILWMLLGIVVFIVAVAFGLYKYFGEEYFDKCGDVFDTLIRNRKERLSQEG